MYNLGVRLVATLYIYLYLIAITTLRLLAHNLSHISQALALILLWHLFVLKSLTFAGLEETVILRFLIFDALYIACFSFVYLLLLSSFVFRYLKPVMFGGKTLSQGSYRVESQVYDLCRKAHFFEKVRVAVFKSARVSAFTVGFSKKNLCIYISTQALNVLSEEELDSVLAHEVGHIVYGDNFKLTSVYAVCSSHTFLFNISLYAFEFFLGKITSDKSLALQRTIEVFRGVLCTIFCGPAYIWLIAISRRRELVSDSFSAELTKDPKFVISALKKISDSEQFHEETVDILPEALYFSPNKKQINLPFSYHPSLKSRLENLKKIKTSS